VVLEGPNGVGKTTVAERAFQFDRAKPEGVKEVYCHRTPGLTGFGKVMRSMLVEKTAEHCPEDEIIRRLLYTADARDYMLEWAHVFKSPDQLVILDRWELSTRAYSFMHGMHALSERWLLRTLYSVCLGMVPDLHILLWAEPQVLYDRLAPRAEKNKDVSFSLKALTQLHGCYKKGMAELWDESDLWHKVHAELHVDNLDQDQTVSLVENVILEKFQWQRTMT